MNLEGMRLTISGFVKVSIILTEIKEGIRIEKSFMQTYAAETAKTKREKGLIS